MSIIRIREQHEEEGWNARVIFDNAAEYPITIQNPFSEKDEELLAWYFKEHLRHPFTDEELARRAARSIQRYGETLFDQIFSDRNAYAQYKDSIRNGIGTVRLEIVGSPSFHALHWEALKDPTHPRPVALETSMVRKNIIPLPNTYTLRPSPTLNILVVTARPGKHQDVGYRTISRPLVELIDRSRIPANIDILRPRTYEALIAHLEKVRDENNDQGYYHIIHFDMHGKVLDYDGLRRRFRGEHRFSPQVFRNRYGRNDIEPYEGHKAFIFFEGADGKGADPVEAHELADLLKSHQVPIAVLNACQSGKQVGASETSLGSYLAQAGTQLVVAMSDIVTVSAAKILMEKVYENLFEGNDCLTAVRSGRLELYYRKGRRVYYNREIDLEDWLLPVVYQNRDVDLRLRDFTSEERATYYSKRADAYPFPSPEFGFFGRDIDILAIEDLLLRADGNRPRNIVMIRGLGGAGKTTLLQHLGAWWQKTQFVDKVTYFGYDEEAWTCSRIVDRIARTVLGNVRYHAEFVPLNSVAQQQMIVDILRSERHLLILDNLESITGDATTMRHVLPKEEQDALHTFLTSLAGGKTYVMIGTRGKEAWLIASGAGNPLQPDDIYDLPGLDPEAVSMLADRIMERNGIDHRYQEDEDFATILKLLDGYPMAMEVILPNLKSRKPSEVLVALLKGDITLDREGATDRTESLILSIEYSFGNLVEDQQCVLLCLAPFTSVIHKDVLERYVELLREQPALAHLSFDTLGAAIGEAADWGLLRPHDRQPEFLKLQPIFPYFLRNRLNIEKFRELQDAIDTAFVEIYRDVGHVLGRSIASKDPSERKAGISSADTEYENLLSALNLALKMKGSISAIYRPISQYLDFNHKHVRGLALGQYVLDALREYPTEGADESIRIEMVGIIDDIGKCQFLLKRFKDSQKSYELALKMQKSIQFANKEEKRRRSASIYHQLGMVAQYQRQWEQAKKYYKKALKIKIESGDRHSQAATLLQLGIVVQELQQWEQAKKYYRKALEIYEEFNDRSSQAGAYNQLGVLAYYQRQWELAEQYYTKALEIFVEFGSRYSAAGVYQNLGAVAQEQRQWEQADQYYRKALEISIELDDRYEEARTYHQLGAVAVRRRQWEQAKQYYEKALEIFVGFDDRDSQASTYHNLGTVAQELRQWERAKQYYEKALEFYVEFGDRYSQASTYHNLGVVAQELQQWKQTEQYYKKALEILVESNDRPKQALIIHNLGTAAAKQQQWKQAEEYYTKALEMFFGFKDNYSIRVTLGSFSQLWADTGNTTIPQTVATILGVTPEEVEGLFRKANE